MSNSLLCMTKSIVLKNCFSTLPILHNLSGKSVKKYTLPSPEEYKKRIPNNIKELVKDYPSLTVVPVQWGDQDAFGHLNNVNFFRYFESGRLAFFEQLINPFISRNSEFAHGVTKIGPIVRSAKCVYKLPVTYPDTLCIATKVPEKSIQKDRYHFNSIIVSEKQGKVVAKAKVEIVTYDYRIGKKAEIPSDLKKILYDLCDKEKQQQQQQ